MPPRYLVFLSGGIGTIVGTLIAYSLHPYFWWIGAVIGGVITGSIPKYREVRRELPRIVRGSLWLMRVSGNVVLHMSTLNRWKVLASVLFLAQLVTSLRFKESIKQYTQVDINDWPLLFLGYMTTMELLILVSILNSKWSDSKRIGILQRSSLSVLPFIGWIFALVWLLSKTPILIRFLAKRLPPIGKGLAYFLVEVYLVLHSELFYLMVFDGMIGVAFTYQVILQYADIPLGPTLVVGGIVGGMISLIHFEWFKVLKPIPQLDSH